MAMVSVGLARRWRALFTTGKGTPGIPGGRGIPGASDKRPGISPVAPARSKLGVFLARLTCISRIRRKPVAFMPTPATTVLSLPSDIPGTPVSLSISPSQSISLSAPVFTLTAVTKTHSDQQRRTKLITLLERVDLIVDGFHRVLGPNLTSKQYRTNLRARAAIHFLLARLQGRTPANDSQSAHRKLIFFVADQILSDGTKADAEKIVSDVFKKYPLLEPISLLQPDEKIFYSGAANTLVEILSEFAGEKRGIYDRYVTFGLKLQNMVIPVDHGDTSTARRNPFQLALDRRNPDSMPDHNATMDSLGSATRADFIQQVKDWGRELKSIGEEVIQLSASEEIQVSSEAALDNGIQDLSEQRMIAPSEREHVRKLGIAKMKSGSNWLNNIEGYKRSRIRERARARLQPGEAWLKNIQQFKSAPVVRNNAISHVHLRSEPKLEPEFSIATNVAPPVAHPAIQAFKDEMLRTGMKTDRADKRFFYRKVNSAK
jgi:hypothetical protein